MTRIEPLSRYVSAGPSADGLEGQEKQDEELVASHKPLRNAIGWVPRATRDALRRARALNRNDRTVYDHDPY